jgi:hypothetical protein
MLGLFVVLCGVCWFFFLIQNSLIQIDIFTLIHYKSDEDLEVNVADPRI